MNSYFIPGYLPNRHENICPRNNYLKNNHGSFFHNTPNWKQFRSPTTELYISKFWYIHTMGCHSIKGTYKNGDGPPQKHCAEHKKLIHKKEHTICFHFVWNSGTGKTYPRWKKPEQRLGWRVSRQWRHRRKVSDVMGTFSMLIRVQVTWCMLWSKLTKLYP